MPCITDTKLQYASLYAKYIAVRLELGIDMEVSVGTPAAGPRVKGAMPSHKNQKKTSKSSPSPAAGEPSPKRQKTGVPTLKVKVGASARRSPGKSNGKKPTLKGAQRKVARKR